MSPVRILFFGDIIGRTGREGVKKILPTLQDEYRPDFILTNAENSAGGYGFTHNTLSELMEAGIDGFTTGNHAFDVRESTDVFHEDTFPIVRPANWPGGVPGRGSRILEKNGKKLLLLNVLGRLFMGMHPNDPFEAVEKILAEHAETDVDARLLDIHAEATSEKRGIAEVFDGKIDVFFGSHTHVQTADARTLTRGSGFISDVGMCGAAHSVIGVNVEESIQRLRTQISLRPSVAEGPCEVNACIADIENGRTVMQPLRLEVL